MTFIFDVSSLRVPFDAISLPIHVVHPMITLRAVEMSIQPDSGVVHRLCSIDFVNVIELLRNELDVLNVFNLQIFAPFNVFGHCFCIMQLDLFVPIHTSSFCV
eukprot:310408_1